MEKKIYNRTYWVDQETPVNAENLNKIEKAIYDLSEQAIRPSDFIQKEDSAIVMNTECGKISFDVNSSVLRTDNSLEFLGITNDNSQLNETSNDLYFFISDLMENEQIPNYKLFYRGIEYFLKSNSIICKSGKTLDEYLLMFQETINMLSLKIDNLESKIKDLEEKKNEPL